jgi:uncharacterized protein YbjT (DUF2867 family)
MFLITGATGNVGRHLVTLLLEAGAQVRAVTRDPEHAGLPADVELVGLDLKSDPAAGAGILQGVHAVFLNPAAVRDPQQFLNAAQDAGVRRVVLLSAMPVRDDLPLEQQPGFIARRHKMIEMEIEASGMEWTHVRSNMLMSNAFFEIAPQIVKGNTVRQAYGLSNSAPVDERDIAAVAAQALLSDAHVGKCYEVTGPESLTERDKVSIIADAIGRDLEFEELTRDQAREVLLATFPVQHSNGAALEHVETVLTYSADSVGVPARVTDTVPRLLGRKAHSYREWAASRAQEFPPAPMTPALPQQWAGSAATAPLASGAAVTS